MLPTLLLLLSCAGTSSPDAPDPDVNAWMKLGDEIPRLCLSMVPGADRLGRSDRQAVAAARQRIAARDTELDLTALPAHPSTDVLLGAFAVLQGEDERAREAFRDLANTYQGDACLQQAAAYTSFRAGRFEYAKPYMDAALALDPDQLDIGLLDAVVTVMATRDEEAGLQRLRRVVAAHPDSAKARAWLGRALAARGDADLALPHLLAARDAGIPVDRELMVTSRLAGDLGVYLSVVGVAPPLPLDVREADDPVAAYKSAIGITGDTLVAKIGTSMGQLTCALFWKEAPVTVGNFVGLATGGTAWVDLQGQDQTGPLYPGTVFHRVIPKFMIQGGDPDGDGSGGPGYAFLDEVHPDLRFDRPGRLAMANSGPATNGSQWFITEVSVPHLDGKHTIFGQCDEASMDVVRAITKVPTGAMDKPLVPVVMESFAFESPLENR